MSIGIIVDTPKDDEEKLFFIPVATEKIFEKYWMPAAQEMNLKWIPIFETGIVIEKEDLPSIIKELKQVEEWVLNNVKDSETSKALLDRITYIINALPNAFDKNDIKLYIG
jgi:hypothetical protein